MPEERDPAEEALADWLPHVMGTQHPDNMSRVPFGDSPKVPRALEDDEVLYNIGTLSLGEMMIDYERKRGNVTPLWDWIHKCHSCLQQKVIGRDFRVTPRIPNGDTEHNDPYFWQSMGIFINALLVMSTINASGIPFKEFIVPDVRKGSTVAKTERHILQRYALQRTQYAEYADGSLFPFHQDFFVQGIPLIETVESLIRPEPIWDELIESRRRLSGKETSVQRSFIARSDPALKAGMLPAILAAVIALDRGRAYERRTGVRVPQILGIGPAPFRGGLTPDSESIRTIAATYPGTATVTVQSAFRYDHPEADVLRACRELEQTIRAEWLGRHDLGPSLEPEDVEEAASVVAALRSQYEASYRQMMPLIQRILPSIPSHRERYQDVSVAGESRKVGGYPAVRAIRFAASCYSLGLPPGLLGLRGWFQLDAEQQRLADRICPRFRLWLAKELQWLNPDNGALFSQSFDLAHVLEDIQAARHLASGQSWSGDGGHHELTSTIAARQDDGADLSDLVLQAAGRRGFLG
jgi:phosphoenolpyruvate carboxylase